MADQRNKSHIFVRDEPSVESFVPWSNGPKTEVRNFDRQQHGKRLLKELNQALENQDRSDELEGTYITFASGPDVELILEKFESTAKGSQPELIAVRKIETDAGSIQEATVYVPFGKKNYFLDRISAYIDTVTKKERPTNYSLVDQIDSIRQATIRELWTDPDEFFPIDSSKEIWWEVWLRTNGQSEFDRFAENANKIGLRLGGSYLGFHNRTVLLVFGGTLDLTLLYNSLDDIAELRRPQTASGFLINEDAYDQVEWVTDLLERT